jgi:hypothetical protein
MAELAICGRGINPHYSTRRLIPEAGMAKKRDVVQVKNPRSGRYVKIDRSEGKILDYKKSEGPYKNVPVARKSSKNK